MAIISDYMKSRKYNSKLYNRLIDELNIIESKHNINFPGLELTISMSAKHQTPFVKIETREGDFSKSGFGAIEEDINESLDKIGFTPTGTEEKFGGYFINFND